MNIFKNLFGKKSETAQTDTLTPDVYGVADVDYSADEPDIDVVDGFARVDVGDAVSAVAYAPDVGDADDVSDVDVVGVDASAFADAVPDVDADVDDLDLDVAEIIHEFLSGLLMRMRVDADVAVSQVDDKTYNVDITALDSADADGNALSILIGRKGETLDAIQRVTNSAVAHLAHRFVRVRLDVDGYHAHRADVVRDTAERAAKRALKFKRSVTLDPMNAFERHIVHEVIQNIKGLSSRSIGVEPNRAVVITMNN